MKSGKNNRAVVVGIFIFIGTAIFIIAILTLGGQQKTFKNSITVRAVFDDVQGLQKGNNVWFSGVKIGIVKKVSFVGNSKVEVDINIEEKSREYIRKNAKARISSEGFIGNKLVEVFGGTPQAAPIEEGDLIAVEKTLSTEEMMGTFQANNRNLLDITSDFKVVSKRLTNGEGTVGKLLTDERLVNQLSSVMTSLQRTSANAERLTLAVAAYTAQLNNKGSLANELVTDTALFARLRATSRQLDEVSKTATEVIGGLNNATLQINSGLNNEKAPLGMLLRNEEAGANISAILTNLNTGTKKLDENMEALQHNFLLKGFFRKKAKREAEARKDSVQR
jgi:phospholipid/cholesterol/gamma-HCH transport system substrate-binding protein